MSPKTSNRCQGCGARKGCVFFNLTPDLHQAYRDLLEVRVYPPGVTLVRQGDEAHGVWNVRAGTARLLYTAPGGRMTSVRLVRQCSILGLTEVTSGVPYQFTVETVEDCVLEYTPRKDFVRFLLDNPQVSLDLLIWLSREYESLQLSLCETVTEPDLETRLLKHLQELGQACGRPTGEGLELRTRLTGQDLADDLGCSRQWISKLLGDLERQGVITRQARRIILTPAALGKEL